MERHFEQQIDKLRTKLIRMCSLVDEQVEFAIRSLEEGNQELANLVIERDNKVDKYDVKVDKICMKLVALNQPVAMDLRLIMSAITINSNLERMGDLAVNIAERAEAFKEKPAFYSRVPFAQIASVAREMVRQAIDSFIDNDAKLASKVIMTDDKLDDLVKNNAALLVGIMKEDRNNIETAVKLRSSLYDLERLGDHATNIAEYVYFIVEALMIKHKYEGILSRMEMDIDSEEEEEDGQNEEAKE